MVATGYPVKRGWALTATAGWARGSVVVVVDIGDEVVLADEVVVVTPELVVVETPVVVVVVLAAVVVVAGPCNTRKSVSPPRRT